MLVCKSKPGGPRREGWLSGLQWARPGRDRGQGLAAVDCVDPSTPTIVVQLVEPSGILGAGISIPTNDASLSGQIEMLASPDGNSLLRAWEGQIDGPRVALARVDCVGGA